MKIIHYLLIAIYVAVLVAVEAPHALMASDRLFVQPAVSAIGFNNPLLAAESSKNTGVQAPKVNVDQNGVILKGYDPVAYFKQHRAVKGDPTYSTSYGGATYYFASADDKAAFDESPAKYAPQYGGYCASGMTKGQLNDCDPNVFFTAARSIGSLWPQKVRSCNRISEFAISRSALLLANQGYLCDVQHTYTPN